MIELKNINKRYGHDAALIDINMTFPETGFVAISGESGCGKSTLLNVIAGIDEDYSGTILYRHQPVDKLSRHLRLTMIFQSYHLIDYLSADHNIRLYDDFHKTSFKAPPEALYASFRQTRVPTLSLGQRQRIAALRAFYPQPDVLLCDEPTASLDDKNKEELMILLKEYAQHALVIFVSHDEELIQRHSDHIYYMEDGVILNTIHFPDVERCQLEVFKKRHPFAILKLALASIRAAKGRFLRMCFALNISILAIILVFTMSFSLRETVIDYLNDMLPRATISYAGSGKDFHKVREVVHVFPYADDYELLGLSANQERYLKNEALFIQDETGYAKRVAYGRMIKNDDEIILPRSTARKLAGEKKLTTLLDQTYVLYYKRLNKVRGVKKKIVGITNENKAIDMVYQPSASYLKNLSKAFDAPAKSHYGLIYFNGSAKNVLRKLRQRYPQTRFKVVGESTRKSVNKTIDRIEFILALFAGFTILSALFMIGEVMYLLVKSHRRDHAIQACFGATRAQLMRQVLYTAMSVAFIGGAGAIILARVIIQIANRYLIPALIEERFVIALSPSIVLLSLLLAFSLALVSSLISMLSVYHLDIVAGLKS